MLATHADRKELFLKAGRQIVELCKMCVRDSMYSYLALVQDDPTIQIVNQAQKAYVEKVAPSVAAMAGLPILSAGAPFKAGGRKNDPTGYTEVNKGELTFRNACLLYTSCFVNFN